MIEVDRLRELEALCAEQGVSLSRLHVGLERIVVGGDPTLAFETTSVLHKNVS